MQLWRFIKFMFGVTALALIYIHMQMNIFSLAYQGKHKEQQISRLREQNGRVSNSIYELKSANYLGRRLLGEKTGLRFCDDQSIVKFVSSKQTSAETRLASSRQESRSNPFSALLQWRFPNEAHAKEQKSLKPWELDKR
ncbi:MAG: hypothetical protein AB1650_05185 [Candidatus Omnitrophota bacterium]